MGITLHKRDITYKFLDRIIENCPKKIDDIYLIRHNIGESYMYLAHAIQWVRANKSKHPVFVAWREKDVHFYKMFLPKSINNYSSIEKHKINNYSKTISFDTTIPEIYVLAQKSKGVITLASGLSVLLTAANTKMDLIYTNFRMKKPHISSTKAIEIYSVYSIPKIDKNLIKEYDIKDYSEESLITKILMRYK